MWGNNWNSFNKLHVHVAYSSTLDYKILSTIIITNIAIDSNLYYKQLFSNTDSRQAMHVHYHDGYS